MKLEGKTALVTGASQGIGAAIALALAKAGADLVVTARSTDKLERVATEIRALGRRPLVVTADMAVETDIDRLVALTTDTFGGADILVNNAGIIHPRIEVADFDPDLWRRVLDVNLTGVFLVTRAVLPYMFERGWGKVINIASIGGRRGAATRSAYRVTKAGLISFTESLAAEVKSRGVDVNAICPGGVRTEGFAAAFGEPAAADPKMIDPAEIAQVAVFLASAEGSAITGTAVDAFGSTNPLFQ